MTKETVDFFKKEPEWVKCPKCKEPVSRLLNTGVCHVCQETLDDESMKAPEVKAVKEYTFDNFNENELNRVALLKAQEFAAAGHSLYLWSPTVGNGKTHLAMAAANILKYMEKDYEYVQLDRLLIEIRSSWSNNVRRTEDQIHQRLATVEYLIIDEIKDLTEFTMNTLYTILTGREREGQFKIFITSNHSLADISDVEKRVSDRILGMVHADGKVELMDEGHRK